MQCVKEKIHNGCREDGTVEAVEHAAVSGEKLAVILYAEFTLDKGECKVAQGRGNACYQRGNSQHKEVYVNREGEAEQNAVKKAEAYGNNKAAYAAFNGLFGTGAGTSAGLRPGATVIWKCCGATVPIGMFRCPKWKGITIFRPPSPNCSGVPVHCPSIARFLLQVSGSCQISKYLIS